MEKVTKPKKEAGTKELIIGLIGLIIIIAVAVWIISSVVHAIGSSMHAHKATASVTAIPSSSPTPAPSKSSAPSKAQLVSEWFTQHNSTLNAFGADFDKISTDAGKNDYAALVNDCTQLSSDATTAQDLPAVPDAQTASDLAKSLTYYQTGGQQCSTAAANDDGPGIGAAADVIVNGNNAMKLAIADIKAVQ